MSVEVVLKPSHATALNGLLAAVYSKNSSQYHHWLSKGQFAARFAPSIRPGAGVVSGRRAASTAAYGAGATAGVR
jgi:hypothetical protein